MAERSGKDGRVFVGTYVVAIMQSWTWSGLTSVVMECTAFEKNFVGKHYGINNFGSIEVVGNYDPDDATGQEAINSAHKNRSKMTNLYFSLDASGTSKWVPDLTNDSSACAVISKSHAIGFDENGMATIAFTAELSGEWCLV